MATEAQEALQDLYANAVSQGGNGHLIIDGSHTIIPDEFDELEELPPFPAGVRSIYIRGLKNLRSLPAWPTDGSLKEITLSYLPSLTSLPAEWTPTTFVVRLYHLHALTTLPPWSNDIYTIVLSDCTVLASVPILPTGMKEIQLLNLPALKEFPPMPVFTSTVGISCMNVPIEEFNFPEASIRSINFVDLPALKKVGPMPILINFRVFNCPMLVTMPEELPKCIIFQLGDAMALKTMPALPKGDYIEVRACGITTFKPWPARLKNLTIKYLPALQEIPPFPARLEAITLSELRVTALPNFPESAFEIELTVMNRLLVLPRIPDNVGNLLVTSTSLTTLTPPAGAGVAGMRMDKIFPSEDDGALVEPGFDPVETFGAYFARIARENPTANLQSMWRGYSKDDVTIFNSMFHAANEIRNDHEYSPSADISFCPVCLGYVSRGDSKKECMYMHHVCPPKQRHEELYQAYKDSYRGEMMWCTVCGRICKDHAHIKLSTVEEKTQERVPYPPGVEVNFFGNDCRPYGGGGKIEKFVRMDTLLQAACDTQKDVGVKEAQEVRKTIVERVWNAAVGLETYPPSLEAAIVKAARPIEARCELPAELAPEVIIYPDIVRPADEKELTPIKHEAPDNECITYLGPHEDNRPVFQFRHKQSNGSVWDHKNQYLCGEDLMSTIDAQTFTGLCPIDPEHCKARLYPEELVGIVPEEYLARYKRLFNETLHGQAGGARGGIMYKIDPNDVSCAIPPKKSGKRRTTYRAKVHKKRSTTYRAKVHKKSKRHVTYRTALTKQKTHKRQY